MTTLEQRRERGDLIHMFRIMTGKDEVSQSTWFQLVQKVVPIKGQLLGIYMSCLLAFLTLM